MLSKKSGLAPFAPKALPGTAPSGAGVSGSVSKGSGTGRADGEKDGAAARGAFS